MQKGCGIIFVNKNNELLICKRSEQYDFGKWCFVGGEINNNETIEEAVIRESMEEVNLKPLKINFIGVSQNNNWIDYTFTCNEYTGNIKLQVEELSEYRWVNINEIEKYDLMEASKQSLKKYKNQ